MVRQWQPTALEKFVVEEAVRAAVDRFGEWLAPQDVFASGNVRSVADQQALWRCLRRGDLGRAGLTVRRDEGAVMFGWQPKGDDMAKQAADGKAGAAAEKPAKLAIRMVRLDQITYDGRVKVDRERVEGLMASIREVGLLHPIGVTKDAHVLVYGRHRLEAFKRAGKTEIPAVLLDLDLDLQDLARIDENLRRRQLSALEESELLAQRKAIYERLHPETKRGGNRRSKSHAESLNGENGAKKSFVEETAAKTGRSKQTIHRQAAIGRDLPKDVADVVRDTPVANRPGDLARLARTAKKDPELAMAAAKAVAAGEAATVGEALAEPKGPPDQLAECRGWLRGKLQRLQRACVEQFGGVAAGLLFAEACREAAGWTE